MLRIQDAQIKHALDIYERRTRTRLNIEEADLKLWGSLNALEETKKVILTCISPQTFGCHKSESPF